ncbi:Hint domain-containing protein [Paracoccus ravus]|uniref:Hint domain-containing protein n=1 Tax=Paracoccus ravus TaxID=2447760 RepID=UPI00106DED97|nr:Hint domain-containing protein [Paracoccus ravus]
MADYDVDSITRYIESPPGSGNWEIVTGSSEDVPGTLTDGRPDTETLTPGTTYPDGNGNEFQMVGSIPNENGDTLLVFRNPADNSYVIYSPEPVEDTVFPDNFTNDDVDTETQIPICFAAGTLISTPFGETAIEVLQIGDPVLTADGRAVPVKWVGRQTLHRIFTPAERLVPVRIRAGALGGGVPHTDLVLTAAHALMIDGLAINAGALVNGDTIAFEPAESLPEQVTYYHVETENHEVILANGAPAETYIDYLGRRAFDNYRQYLDLYGGEPVIAEMKPLRVSARRQVPKAIRERLGISLFGDHPDAVSAGRHVA